MKHLHTLQKNFFKGTLEHYCVADYNPWYACPHKRTYSRLHSRVLLKERLRNKNQNNKKNLKCNRKWLFPGIHKTRYHSSDQLLLEFTIGARCFTLKIQWKATLTAGTVTGECFLPLLCAPHLSARHCTYWWDNQKKKKRGTRATVQVRLRRYRRLGSWL